jgi:hypothetical protein
VEPLRPLTPNTAGTATAEPLLPELSFLSGQPLYPQFLRPLGADSLAVNNPGMFFPDGVPGYEPATNPYATSPFFPNIPEVEAPNAPVPISSRTVPATNSPPEAAPQLIPTVPVTATEEAAATTLPTIAEVPVVSVVPLETATPNAVAPIIQDPEQAEPVVPLPAIPVQSASILADQVQEVAPEAPEPNVPQREAVLPNEVPQVVQQENLTELPSEDLALEEEQSQTEAPTLVPTPPASVVAPAAPAEGSDLPAEVPTTTPPIPTIASQSLPASEESVALPAQTFSAPPETPAPNLPERLAQQAEAPIQLENPMETAEVTQESLAALGNLTALSEVPEVAEGEQPLQEENSELQVSSELTQQTPVATPQENGLLENPPAPVATENAQIAEVPTPVLLRESSLEQTPEVTLGTEPQLLAVNTMAQSEQTPAAEPGLLPDITATEDAGLAPEGTASGNAESMSDVLPLGRSQAMNRIPSEETLVLLEQATDNVAVLSESALQVIAPEDPIVSSQRIPAEQSTENPVEASEATTTESPVVPLEQARPSGIEPVIPSTLGASEDSTALLENSPEVFPESTTGASVLPQQTSEITQNTPVLPGQVLESVTAPEMLSPVIPSTPEVPSTGVQGQLQEAPRTPLEAQISTAVPPEQQEVLPTVVPEIALDALVTPENVVPSASPEAIPAEDADTPIQTDQDERGAQVEPDQEIPGQTPEPEPLPQTPVAELPSQAPELLAQELAPPLAELPAQAPTELIAPFPPAQASTLPSISEDADLQEQAQALFAALGNRLAQLESPAPSVTLLGGEPEAAADPEVAAPTPVTAEPIPSLADLSAQLDEEGQAALTDLVSQSDGVTSPPADLLANVTDQLPPNAVPALENILQSGLLPVAETQLTETQQLTDTQSIETQPTTVSASLPENLPDTLPPAASVPAEEASQDQTPQAEQPLTNFRGAEALSAFQSLSLSMPAEETLVEQPEVPEYPAVEPQEVALEAVIPTPPVLEDATPELEAPQIPDQPSQPAADLEIPQISDQPAQTTAELDGLQATAPQAIEPLAQAESPQLQAEPSVLSDSDTQQIQDTEEHFPLPQDEEATPLSPNLGLGISPFLPIALDNLSTFIPLDATATSTTPTNFQNFAPLTFTPSPQSQVGSEDTPQSPTVLGQSSGALQPQTTTLPLEENQIAEAPVEQASDLSGQAEEIPPPSQAQDLESSQEHQLPLQAQDIASDLEPETVFPPATMVGTPADQEAAAFLGTMFAAAEPLGQAALDSLVQMPEARQLEISNALPIARRPAALAETPTPQVPTQQLQASGASSQFTDIPNQDSLEQPKEPAFEGDQPPQTTDPQAPTYPQATTPLEFASPQTATPKPTTIPQTFEQTTPASPTPGYVQSDQPLIYRAASTPQTDSSLGDPAKPVIDQSGIEELLNLGTDNHYEAPEPPAFKDETSADEDETPLGQLFRQGMEKGPPPQRETAEQEQESSPTNTMEAPEHDDDDDDGGGGGGGASLESLARQIYYMVRHRIDREKERHGGHQDRGGW